MKYKKALNRNIPWFTLFMVTFTLTMGMIIGVSCYIFYIDLFDAQAKNKSLNAEGYLTLNKKVKLLNVIGGGRTSFSESEIESIKNQSFVDEVAPFSAAKFRIKAYAPLHEERSFFTDLFLESVPAKFLDVGEGFSWETGKPQLPIIIPRTYLNLYNFGFAPSQGLPQITRQLLDL